MDWRKWLHHNWPLNPFCCHKSDCIMVDGRKDGHDKCPYPNGEWMPKKEAR